MVGAAVLQYVVVDLVVGLWEGPNDSHGVVTHLTLGDLDLRSSGNCKEDAVYNIYPKIDFYRPTFLIL